MSDTPRTDKEIVGELLVFASFARKLERELTAVTEERDELKSKYRTHHDEAERITNEIRRVSSVSRKLKQELATVAEQRDRLAEAMIPAMTRAYTRGYNHGHADTVESAFMLVHANDELEVFADDVLQMLLDGSQPEAQSALAAVKGGSDE
jgi:seryl-tRNA synthetase